MSFILDALQRADAQRERGGVPGLHTRQVASAIDTAQRGSRAPMGLAGGAVLALALGAAVAWLWLTAAPTPAPPSPAPLTPNASGTAGAPAPNMARVPAPTPTVALAPPPKLAPEPGSTPPQRSASTPKVPASAVKDVAAAELATAPLLSELSEDLRRQMPALTITGSVYSENPAQRLLLVNGQVVSQGSLVAPDLRLVAINAASSEFSYRGTRFRLAY